MLLLKLSEDANDVRSGRFSGFRLFSVGDGGETFNRHSGTTGDGDIIEAMFESNDGGDID